MSIRFRGAQYKVEFDTSVSLQEQLLTIKENTYKYVPREKLAIHERAIAEIAATGISDRILHAGSKMPAFSLTDQRGNQVDSAELLKQGPLIIDFFRGRWDPYCITELEAWRDLAPKLKEAGIQVIAISPMLQKQAAILAEQHTVLFPVLADVGNAVAKQFGLVHRVPAEQESLYRAVFVNLPVVNGDHSWELPLPATYAIAQDGTIVSARANADFMVRPEPQDVIESLRRHA